ncbi:3-hydroxyisobutyrate dehydrogenase [Humitalea rosea]|uniref:3-hydroxyisobutyrate dehydrogenase n=1 Tax=Humitalea rosea TaxID=990373 RepID=A0A2W7I1N0_9PROT|nr:NAD(P)-dependent oxidoreductase [Humitalea rosea]PZW39342.1 3-hydroxyisobutyrate dehydrogenase [Humitalea rosea]
MAGPLEGIRIAWIGVGNMGLPMARRLLGAGAALVVCDRDPRRVVQLVAEGAEAAARPAAAIRGAALSFSMVPDDAALRAVVGGPDGVAGAAGPGLVHVDLSTVSPAASAEVAAALAAGGAGYLRCPVSGSTVTAATGQLTLFCSGPVAALERCGPALDVLGARRLHLGLAEEARVLKLLVNLVVAAMPALLGEALAFGTRLGLPRDVIVDALGQSVVGTPLLAYKADAIKREDWTPAASIDLLSKDLDLALGVAREAGIAQPLVALVREHYAARQACGEGGLDFFSLTASPAARRPIQ